MLQLFLGQIPEAIFFALFMIYAKGLKEKRILFIVLMIVEYLLLKLFFSYNLWFQISYTVSVFFILKIIYKEKAQITDIFTFGVSNLVMMIISIPLYFIVNISIKNLVIFAIIDRIALILFLLIFHKKLNKIQSLYKKLWNRNDTVKKRIKTTTFRAINVIIFNIIFYTLNIIILYNLCEKGGV